MYSWLKGGVVIGWVGHSVTRYTIGHTLYIIEFLCFTQKMFNGSFSDLAVATQFCMHPGYIAMPLEQA